MSLSDAELREQARDTLRDLATRAREAADTHATQAASISQRCQSFSYGDDSGTTEAHTAAIAWAAEAQVHATLALQCEVRAAVLTFIGGAS